MQYGGMSTTSKKRTFKRAEILAAIRKTDRGDNYYCPVFTLVGAWGVIRDGYFDGNPFCKLTKAQAIKRGAMEMKYGALPLVVLSRVFEATAPECKAPSAAYKEWLCNWVKKTFPREVTL